MSKWKDFLYFHKGDRVAIILLSVLICLGVIISIYLFNFEGTGETYFAGTEQSRKKFVDFENDMSEVIPESDISDRKDAENLKVKTTKLSTTKLTQGQIVDLNIATVETLIRLPGIGQTLAERIVDYRSQLGGFSNLEQLQEIKGITVNRFSNILPHLALKKKHHQINVNQLSENKLILHPYLNDNQVKLIASLRQSGKINSMEELAVTDHFTVRDVERLQPYLSFD